MQGLVATEEEEEESEEEPEPEDTKGKPVDPGKIKYIFKNHI